MSLNRRDFLKSSVAASIMWGAVPLVGARPGRVYRTALIGSGWWGMNILRTALEGGQCTPVALCDVDRNQLVPAAAEIEKLSGTRPALYEDYRDLLSREKPEVVIVATPDHWHALAMIAAVEAGAHVYVEKPISHTIAEGRAMVDAARAANRVVQVGLHRRVSPHNISANAFLKSGRVGKIGMVRAFVHYAGGAGSPAPDAEPPDGLNWDLWCGPAPLRPYNPRIHPRGFRQYLEYANGQLGDWGVHWLDQILWWTEERYPRLISSSGGRAIKDDGTNAPDHQVVTYAFEDFTCTWEHRMFGGNPAEKHSIGVYFYGTEGTFHLGWLDGWTFYPTSRGGQIVHEEPRLNKPDDQNIRELWADFMQAIESGRRPVNDIESGHRSTTMSLLGMLALKAGRTVTWDGERETIPGDPEAAALLTKDYRGSWTLPG